MSGNAIQNSKIKKYRSLPFWAWNGKLDVNELKKQLVYMKKMGFGGVFMHSRTGLATEYLGEEWFNCIKKCAVESEKLGLKAWIYDEDRWPSGSAGGVVSANPRYRSKYISMQQVEPNDFDMANYRQGFLQAFAVKINDGILYDYYKITNKSMLKQDYKIQVYFIEEMAKSDFYNGFTYIDTLSREATDEYIKSTHELYKAKCGEMFGKQLIGIFTDEPQRGCCFGGFGIDNLNKENMTPFTYELPSVFFKMFGYDILSVLPELYYSLNGKKWSSVSYDYMTCLQKMFIENYAKPIYEWCNKNKLILTGHILHEDSLCNQAAPSGSVQLYYEYMTIPGVDVLGGENYSYWVAKQVDSVKRQLNKKFALSETYGCTGWQFPFEGHKFIGDWQAIYGINLRCQHLAWYSMAGEAKRDYPASIFFQSAWYEKYSYVEDYFGRLNYFCNVGESVTDVLVINPVESVYGYVRKNAFSGIWANTQELKELEEHYFNLFHSLTNEGVSFDIGDEDILSRHSKIVDDSLFVGQAKYNTVIVSGAITLRSSTIKLLNDFIKRGGKVIIDKQPLYVDGKENNTKINATELCDLKALCVAAKENSAIKIEIPKGILFNLRYVKKNDEYYLTVINGDTKNDKKEKIKINIPYNAYETDIRNNEIKYLDYLNDGKNLTLHCSFNAGEEHCFTLTKNAIPVKKESENFTFTHYNACSKYTLSEPNVAVLDLPLLKLNGEVVGTGDVLLMDRELRRKLDLPLRGGGMVQPWYKEKYLAVNKLTAKNEIELIYNFKSEHCGKDLYLALEQPLEYKICLNGKDIEFKDCGYYVDPCIRKSRLDVGLLTKGENILTLKATFKDELNLEAIYLLGDFGVSLDGKNIALMKPPLTLDSRPLKEQGFPFYSGVVTYHAELEGLSKGINLKIKINKMQAACYEVKVGKNKEVLAFPPYISGEMVGNSLDVSVYCTRRNTFGPLRLKEAIQPAYGPETFILAPMIEGFNLLDEGLDFSYAIINKK